MLTRKFSFAQALRLDPPSFHRVQIHRNNFHYEFLMKLCELVFDCTLPVEGTGRFRFEDITRNEIKMRLVFQSFVRNFFAREQFDFAVKPLQLHWDAIADTQEAANYLPVMVTDMLLWSRVRSIIVDTKYYTSTLSSHHGKALIDPENLYQMFSYLKNAERRADLSGVEGMLIYPTVSQDINLGYHVQGHRIRVRTISLNQAWPQIALDLEILCAIKVESTKTRLLVWKRHASTLLRSGS